MLLKGKNLCDFCFEPMGYDNVCTHCGLNHDNYNAEPGLLMPGTNLLGKYIIGRVLGRGGFGATYLAYSSDRNEVVAIKEYYPTGIANRAKNEEKISIVSDDKRKVFEKGANRFFEEAKTVSKFNSNKNIVSVYEFFYANDTVYYSMEYLEGIDLKNYIAKKGGRIDEAEAVAITKEVCEALVAVHSTQTLHRDISPDNIFVCTNGYVKLIDFGAAKQVIGDSQQVYSVVVKQGFAPAEQYKSNGKQGVWTDIYAVGATLYYALTGSVPTDAMNRIEDPNIQFDPSLNISPQLKNIITKCLQSKIEDRYQSAIELLTALNELDVEKTVIGGKEYVQSVYNGVISSGLQGQLVDFANSLGRVNVQPQQGYNPYANSNNYSQWQMPPQNNTQFMPQGYPTQGYPQSAYPQSGYLPQGYPQSQYQMDEYVENKEKSGMWKGIVIGVFALLIVALLAQILIFLINKDKGESGALPPASGLCEIGKPALLLTDDILPSSAEEEAIRSIQYGGCDVIGI